MSTSPGQRRFIDKVVIITGSSSGIGQEAALEFAKEGASLVIHGQNAQKLDTTEKLLLTAGIPPERVLKIIGSLEDRQTGEKIISETVEKFGKIDVLVNNAGATTKPGFGPENYMDIEALDYLYEVNFRSPVQLSMLALPHLKRTNGNVLNISSIASIRTGSTGPFYASLKAAFDHWTRNFAQLGAPNVRVNSLNPGPIDTPIFERNNVSPELRAYFGQKTLLGRFGTPKEMATIMKFLCSDEASFITGNILFADGGMAVKFN